MCKIVRESLIYLCANQSVANIFEYLNILVTNIRTFVCINFSFTNILGHSFVSNLFVRIYSDILDKYSNIRTIFKTNIWAFVRVKFFDTNIFVYSLV